MTEEENKIMDGARRLRACKVILGDAVYTSPSFAKVFQTAETELMSLNRQITTFLPKDYERDA